MKIVTQSFYRYFIIIALLLNVIGTLGNPSFQFRHFNINNGLSQNSVFSILQDEQGFMWFGTKDGLNRFDGESFKIYRFPLESGLKNNVCSSILQDKNDKIWIGTEDGLYIYDPLYESFESFNLKTNENDSIQGLISDMLIDADGDIWISVEEKGVFMYNNNEKRLDFYAVEVTPGNLKGITLCEDNGRGVWVFPYSEPINRIDKKSKRISEFSLNSGNSLFDKTGEIGTVIADGNNLLIGTSQLGLLSLDVSNKSVTEILSTDQVGNPIFIRDILKLNDNLWIASESGVYIYNLYSGDLINLKYNPSVASSISDNAIYSLYIDKEQGVWIGSYFGGVDYLPNHGTYFQNFYPIVNENNLSGLRVREFHQADEGNIWIGTEDKGLNLFNPDKSTFLKIDNQLASLYSNIHALYQDDDLLWIGTFSKGLHRYNLKDKTLKSYQKGDNQKTLIGNSIFSIYKDSRDTLWIGTISGLNTYNSKDDDFNRIKYLEGLFIQDIMEDSDGNIWFATFLKGLYRFNPTTKEWRNYLHDPADSKSLPFNKITSVFEDSNNRIWITTEGGGFCQFNKEENSFTTIDSSKGLLNNVVYQILEDEDSNLWLSTNLGIVKYSPENGILQNYTIKDGLKTNQFNYKSSFKTKDGTLYFGSIDGFVRFNPSSFKESSFAPPIVFTQLLINNLPVEISDEITLLDKSIQYLDKLELDYRQNSFGLKYAVLNFSENKNHEVLYKLDGYDQVWMSVDESRTISYSNLPTGKYALLVSTLNKDVLKRLTIVVNPPFWLTWWAYLTYLLLFISALFFIVKYINRSTMKSQRQKMRLFEQINERKLYESKIDFFTNVAHEIRTPLSLIKAPLDEVLKKEELSKDIREDLEIMGKNTDRLLELTGQLLDFQKTESELYSMDMRAYNIPQIVKDTVQLFTPLSKIQNISLELELSEGNIIAQIDKEAFKKIISNLIGNAIKYCDTFVHCSLSYVDNAEPMVEFITKNDGPTIPDNSRESIFKPFIHINRNNSETINGTGVGLALAKSLVKLMNGTINYKIIDGLNVFSVSFPAQSLMVSEADINSEQHNSYESESKKSSNKVDVCPVILIVEDDNDMNNFLKRCFIDEYNVFQAKDGEEALEIILKESINIVVTDVMMPNLNGYELTAKIKSNIETSHIPVILLTAKTTSTAKIEGYEKGADMYIEKPFSVEVLQAQVASLLKSRETMREAFMKHPFIGVATVALTKSDESFIKKLNNIVIENLSDSAFNVEDLAEQFNMSRASFYRKIKGVLDLTPNEYIRVERLKKGAHLLKEGNYKINEICYMVGFNSPSYFAKCFQQQFGILPKDFQEK